MSRLPITGAGVRTRGEVRRMNSKLARPKPNPIVGRAGIRAALRQKRREETLIRHGKPLRYCEDGRVVFAACFTRSR